VAAIAEERLGLEARAMVRELGAPGSLSAHDLATWADSHRTEADAPWHFVNIPFGQAYRPARDCPAGACVVAAIDRFRAELRAAERAEDRLAALRWLVHLVGDVHQPLHAGSGLDRGGNLQRVRVGRRGEPTSLHRVWDDEVVEALARGRSRHALARALLAAASPARLQRWAEELDPAAWAQASSRQAQAVYARLELTPQGHGVAPRSQRLPVVSEQDREAWAAQAGQALLVAGVRLAAVLDEAAGARTREGLRHRTGSPPRG
jgi:hypothetical protein